MTINFDLVYLDTQLVNIMMMASTTDTNSNNEYDDLLRDIFNMNDVNKEGFITIQSFLTIIKENWPSSLDESVSHVLFEFLSSIETNIK